MSLLKSDRLHLLKAVQVMTDTGKWNGLFTYPSCGWDLIKLGYVVNKDPTGVEITRRGRYFLQRNEHLLTPNIHKWMTKETSELNNTNLM